MKHISLQQEQSTLPTQNCWTALSFGVFESDYRYNKGIKMLVQYS